MHIHLFSHFMKVKHLEDDLFTQRTGAYFGGVHHYVDNNGELNTCIKLKISLGGHKKSFTGVGFLKQ